MDDNTRMDIRRLLKTFGVKADEMILTYLTKNPDVGTLHLRVTLEDLTDYGENRPAEPLSFEVQGEVKR